MSNQTVYRKLFKRLIETPSIGQTGTEPLSGGRMYALIHRQSNNIPESLRITSPNILEQHIDNDSTEYVIPTAATQQQSWW